MIKQTNKSKEIESPQAKNKKLVRHNLQCRKFDDN